MVHDTSLLNAQNYKVRIGGKVEQGSLRVTLNYGWQLYLLLLLKIENKLSFERKVTCDFTFLSLFIYLFIFKFTENQITL